MATTARKLTQQNSDSSSYSYTYSSYSGSDSSVEKDCDSKIMPGRSWTPPPVCPVVPLHGSKDECPVCPAVQFDMRQMQSVISTSWNPTEGMPKNLVDLFKQTATSEKMAAADDTDQLMFQFVKDAQHSGVIDVTPAAVAPRPNIDKIIDDYDEALSGTQISASNKVWQRVKGLMADHEKLAYKKLEQLPPGQKHSEMEAFRVRMVSEKRAVAFEERSQTKSFSKIDMTIGVHYPFEIIVKKKGGFKSKSVVKAACTRVMKCIVMGPPFIEYNEMSERVEFLFVRKRNMDVFEKQWTQRKGAR